MEITKAERKKSNPLYNKLRVVYYNMMQRCYNSNHPSYKSYGAKGVYVCDEWQTLDGFLDTIDTVEGFDKDTYVTDNKHLDKDIKYTGNKLYSPHTCLFVSADENKELSYKSRMKETEATDKHGNTFVFMNRKKFCKENGLDDTSVCRCLDGTLATHKGWRFRYTDGTSKKNNSRKYEWKIGVSPKGETFEFTSTELFGKEHNLSSKGIQRVVRGDRNTYKGWKFYYKN